MSILLPVLALRVVIECMLWGVELSNINALVWLCGPDRYFHQANVRCHISVYTMSAEAKSCQFLFLPSVFASGRPAKNKLENKTEKWRRTKYYPMTGSSWVSWGDDYLPPNEPTPLKAMPSSLAKTNYSDIAPQRVEELKMHSDPQLQRAEAVVN